MHYLIYKITNRLDNKFYVGKHKTADKNDDYFGSGLLLERAVQKHGKENFVKEILFELPTEDEMNQREADIVDEDFVARDDTYNIKLGGVGGWDYVNAIGKNINDKNQSPDHLKKLSLAGINRSRWLLENDPEFRRAWSEKASYSLTKRQLTGNLFSGHRHTDETKQKMSLSKKGKFMGKDNPAYGTMWITNGSENRKIKRFDKVPSGLSRGRS